MQLLDTMLCMPPWRGCNKSVRCKIIYSFTGSFEVVRHLLKLLRTPDAYIARSSWRGCSGKDESGGVAWRVAAGSTAEMVDAPELTLTACKLRRRIGACFCVAAVAGRFHIKSYIFAPPSCHYAIMMMASREMPLA